MKIKGSATLWGSFVASIFFTMMVSSFVITGLLMMAEKNGLINFRLHKPLFPIVSFLLTGIVVGTMISMFVGHRIMKPLINLSDAIKEVSHGNFDIRLNEKIGLEQVRETAHSFNIMTHELSGIETLRNDFISNVSHEFKTPLASIEGYATLLQSSGLSEADKLEYTRLIIESTKKLSTLTSNILSLSKLENQEILPDSEQFFLDEQLRRVLLSLEPQWSAKEIDLDIELEPTLFIGSEELLEPVWFNLLGNAIKFTPAGGTVGIDIKSSQSKVFVTVSDTGIGISPHAQQHIFEKFYQADKMRASDGNGLGLALVGRIISLCKGGIDVKSQEGKGTSFTVWLPDKTLT